MSLVILKDLLKLERGLTKDKKGLLFCRSENPKVGHKSKTGAETTHYAISIDTKLER